MILGFSLLKVFGLLINFLTRYRYIQIFYFLLSHFCSLYISRNLTILSKLSNLLAHNCSQYPLIITYFCKVSSNIPPFITDFSVNNLSLLPFCHGQPSQSFINFVDYFKESTFSFINFLYCLFYLFLLCGLLPFPLLWI